uniref:LITAF domain-containing protein n=2 Tax=Poecilia formosa TaxID=48698 RepID=A0A096M193_POEFO
MIFFYFLTDKMDKGEGPPKYTAAIPEMLAPPYPGPPLDSSVAPQPAASYYQQPVPQQYPQPVAQQYPQPAAQQYQQPVAQQYPQPVDQKYQQPVAQQYQQSVDQQYQQPAPQPNIQLGKRSEVIFVVIYSAFQYNFTPFPPVFVSFPNLDQFMLHSVNSKFNVFILLVHQTVVQQNQATQPANPVVVQVRPTEAPVNMMCQFCKTKVMTVTEYKLGMLTWLIAGVLFIFGIWPCCLIPFFVGACKDVQHSCPQCNNVLHVYRRM